MPYSAVTPYRTPLFATNGNIPLLKEERCAPCFQRLSLGGDHRERYITIPGIIYSTRNIVLLALNKKLLFRWTIKTANCNFSTAIPRRRSQRDNVVYYALYINSGWTKTYRCPQQQQKTANCRFQRLSLGGVRDEVNHTIFLLLV